MSAKTKPNHNFEVGDIVLIKLQGGVKFTVIVDRVYKDAVHVISPGHGGLWSTRPEIQDGIFTMEFVESTGLKSINPIFQRSRTLGYVA